MMMTHLAILKHRFRRLRTLKSRLKALGRRDGPPPSYHEIFEVKLEAREVPRVLEQKVSVEHVNQSLGEHDAKAPLPQYALEEKLADDAAVELIQPPRFRSDIKPASAAPAPSPTPSRLRTLVERARRQLHRENELHVMDKLLRNNCILQKWERKFLKIELSIVFLFIWLVIYFEFLRVISYAS